MDKIIHKKISKSQKHKWTIFNQSEDNFSFTFFNLKTDFLNDFSIF